MEAEQPIRLFLDWDGTIALTDTLSIIASIGYAKNGLRELPPWSHFTGAYIADYSAHAASYKPQKSDRTLVEQELAWLESLVDVERKSIERVEAAGIFASVTTVDVQAAAAQAAEKQEVRLRSGLVELLGALTRTKGSASIISVNWSRTFITEFLKTADKMTGWRWPIERIWANEIEFGTGGKLTRLSRKENRGIWTAGDKSRIFREATALHDRGHVSVYMGDSSTDLDCLLSADVGICVRDEPMASEQKTLAETLERLAIACLWVGNYHSAEDLEKDFPVRTGKTLWWARDFKEVADSPLFTR